MRFAGQAISDFTGGAVGVEDFLGNSPDYGKGARASSMLYNEELLNNMNNQSEITNTGISSKANAKAGVIKGEGEAAKARGQAQGSMFESLGGIGSSFISGMPDMFGWNKDK